MKQTLIWMGALMAGAVLGVLQIEAVDTVANFVATVYTRLFQLLAVPTVVLAVTTTLATLGNGGNTGRVFRHTIAYTLLTTFVAAAVGLALYVVMLMSGIGAPIAVLGIILPIYTIIDMVETAVNVWSDSCVAAMVHRDLTERQRGQA